MSNGNVGDPTHGLVLLDVLEGEDQRFAESFLERNGHDVNVCHGPEVEHLCPVLGGSGCTKFDAAHGVVFELDLDRAQHRAIVRRYRELSRPDMPIRVVVRGDQAARYGDLLADVEVWSGEPNAAQLDGFLAEVEAADRFVAAG